MQLINAMICPAGELDLGVPICTELMGSGLQHILKVRSCHLPCFPMESDGPTTVAELFSV